MRPTTTITIRLSMLLLLILPAVAPAATSGEISGELYDLLIQRGSVDVVRLEELLTTEVVTIKGIEAVYRVIISETPPRKKETRLHALCSAVERSLIDHQALLLMLHDLPEASRPLRSFLSAQFLLVRRGTVGEPEFRQLELLMVQDLDRFVGRGDRNRLTGVYDLVAAHYHGTRGFSPNDPEGCYEILSRALCRAGTEGERADLASAMGYLNHPGTITLFEGELSGRGCTPRLSPLTRRTMLDHLASLPSAAEIFADLLPDLDDDETYAMALLVCGISPGLQGDLGFHQAVFGSFKLRAEGGEPADSGVSSVVSGHMTGYIRNIWSRLTENILFRPRRLAEHATIIGQHTPKDSILQLAATHGSALQEPFLSTFTERIYSKGSPVELAEMLQSIGVDRLPDELRRRAVGRVNENRIPLKN